MIETCGVYGEKLNGYLTMVLEPDGSSWAGIAQSV